MIQRLITMLIWMLLIANHCLPSFSQTEIVGNVCDKNKAGLSDISVTLMLAADSSIVDYGFTDAKGYYNLSYKGDSANLLIMIYAFDIKRQTKSIENKSQTVNFIAEKGSIALKEVVVKSAKIWGEEDTINYLVSAFKDKQDMVIGDVLKKMPGIDVRESGEITYRGKPINKFYIEHLDMLQGRYGLATNNISANDIATVQVLENHQPIKALENTQLSNDAAINLKMKESKKGIFSVMAMLGIGRDKEVRWQEKLTGMYFTNRRQQLFTYETNNSGTDINKELKSFTADNPIGNLQLTDIQQPTPPSIRFERYNFNTTHAVTVNNLFKLKNEAELTTNLTYYHNKDNRHSFARTFYILAGEPTKIIEENISTQSRINNINAELQYNLNQNRNYFNNYLNICGNWNEGSGEVVMAQSIGQRLHNKSFSVKNFTHWIKKNEDENGFEISSKNTFRTQPHTLRVTPEFYSDIINSGNKYTSLIQDVRYNALSSINTFSFLSAVVTGNMRINPTANANIEYQTLWSDMETTDSTNIGHSVLDSGMRNDINWTRISTGISIDVVYNSEKLKINFNLPLSYRYTIVDNKNQGEKAIHANKFYFQPSITARYYLSNQIEVNSAAGYYFQTPGLSSLYTGYILQNYRSLCKYDTQLFDSNMSSASLSLSYKNVIEMLFASGEICYNHYQRAGIYAQNFDGILSETQVVMHSNGGYKVSVNGKISKGFDWKSLVFNVEASWGKSINDHMRQDKLVNYNSQWTNISGSAYMKPVKWLLTDFEILWGLSKGKTSSGESFKPIQSLIQQITIDLSLPHNINFTGSVERYYNSAIQGNKNFTLADLGFDYVYKKIRFSVDWTNIFNTKEYISASYNAMNSYYSEYDIRQMALMFKVRFKLL